MACQAAAAVDWSDPFENGKLPAPTSFGTIKPRVHEQPCGNHDLHTALSIADVVDRALCHNPKSSQAWANARFEAAQVGVAKAQFLPSISVRGAVERNRNSGAGQDVTFNSLQASASLSYLLYDFGGRDAVLENARQLFQAASATQDSVVQGLFLSAIQGYYQVNASQAAVESTREAERAALASLDAATARYKAGVATPADKLQAQTAWSQAVLNRITAEGNQKTARGNLANVMGLDPNTAYELQPQPVSPVYEKFQASVDELIAEARRHRPDLVAAEAQVKAAKANIDAAKAAGKPSFSVTTDLAYVDRQFFDSTRAGVIGLNVEIPLFTGFSSTYKIRSAQELAEVQKAARDQINLQIGLDVWNAFYNLQTQTQAVESSKDLVSSATQNADVALGRYKAGVGNIIDVITAQSALASARAQQIQAGLNWDIARASMAFAMGQLDDIQTYSTENRK